MSNNVDAFVSPFTKVDTLTGAQNNCDVTIVIWPYSGSFQIKTHVSAGYMLLAQ